jgi:Putative zinc-finger
MNCEEALEAIADRLTGDLDAASIAVLRQHLEICPGCAAEARALQRLWDGLGVSDEQTPSVELRRRFDAMLRREAAAAARSTVDAPAPSEDGGSAAIEPFAAGRFRQPSPLDSAQRFRSGRTRRDGDRRALERAALGFALAAALAVSLGAGIWIGSSTAAKRGADDVAQLRDEIRSLRSTVALALLTEPSASERLSGVAWGRELQTEDRRVADALFERLLDDPNVNVRLAALDALREVAGRPDTRRRLLESIPEQDSPLVQISAIDVLLEAAPGSPSASAGAATGGVEPGPGPDAGGSLAAGSRADLARLAADPALDEVVRGYLRDRLERSSP